MKFTSEQLSRINFQKQKAALCSKFYVSSYREDQNTIYVRSHPLLCHSHFCEKCNRIRRASLYYSLIKWAKHRHLRFFTLTYSHDEDPMSIIERCSKDWNKFILYLRRDGYTFNYFKVIEFTKKDYVHFHFLVDIYVPQATLTRIWRDVTGHSYITWASDTWSNKKCINYLLKYVTKSFEGAQDYFAAFRLRRYSFSRYSYDFQSDRESFPSEYKYHFEIFFNLESLKQYYKTLFASRYISGPAMKYPDFVFLE